MDEHLRNFSASVTKMQTLIEYIMAGKAPTIKSDRIIHIMQFYEYDLLLYPCSYFYRIFDNNPPIFC